MYVQCEMYPSGMYLVRFSFKLATMESSSIEKILLKIGEIFKNNFHLHCAYSLIFSSGFGKVQIQLIFIGALILLTALNETLGTSFLLPASECDLNMTTQDKGFLSGMTFLGVTVSSYFWGFLGDTQGRKWVIMRALILSSFFSILSAFMKHFTLFVICRFMVGVL